MVHVLPIKPLEHRFIGQAALQILVGFQRVGNQYSSVSMSNDHNNKLENSVTCSKLLACLILNPCKLSYLAMSTPTYLRMLVRDGTSTYAQLKVPNGEHTSWQDYNLASGEPT